MENFYISRWFDWEAPKPSKRAEFANRMLRKCGFWLQLRPPGYSGQMTNIEQRINMFHLVSQVLAYKVPGDLVELGCNTGTSSAVIQKIIQQYDPSRKLHVYDSFEGLPSPAEEDGDTGIFQKGELKASRAALIENFKRYDLPLPEIHQGWFEETLVDLPDPISFAYLDGDFYESILISLQHVYPKLSPGAVCLIDDYADPAIHDGWNLLPGVKKACDEYLAGKPEKMSYIYAGDMSHGFFRKL